MSESVFVHLNPCTTVKPLYNGHLRENESSNNTKASLHYWDSEEMLNIPLAVRLKTSLKTV